MSSLTAPNGLAQESLIKEALSNAGVKSQQVSYIEAHGTGTPLGDPIEVGALGQVYSEGRSKDSSTSNWISENQYWSHRRCCRGCRSD